MSVVLVTGSSTGFGFEAALAFARNGDSVVATMRDTSKATPLLELAQKEGLTLDVQTLDVTKAGSFDSLLRELLDKHGRLDVLVNNAGIHRAGALEDLEEQVLRAITETNYLGPLLLAKAALPIMRRQQSGLIIMLSSLSGVAGLPGDVAYAASKFAIEGATEALRHEVDRWGIRVALVEPGLHKTDIMSQNFDAKNLLPADYPQDSPYRELIEWQLRNLRDRMPDGYDPANVGRLLVAIAEGSETKLRWPADPTAEKVIPTLFALDDHARDEFLRNVAGSDWWSQGKSEPEV